MKKLNSRGFGTIEVLLIVLVVLTVGGVGYYVYQSKKSTEKSSSNVQSEPQKSSAKTTTTPTDSTTNQSTLPAATSADYLVIKEWGIKVKIPGADKLTYTIVPQSGGTTPDGSGEYVDAAKLYLTDAVTTNSFCKNIGIGIGRSKLITKTSPLPTVGNYVFDVSGSPFTCDNAQLDAIRSNYTGNHSASWTYSAN